MMTGRMISVMGLFWRIVLLIILPVIVLQKTPGIVRCAATGRESLADASG